MKALALKPEGKNFNEHGKTPHSINKRKLLKLLLVKESKLVSKESVAILHEFKRL